MSTSALQIRGGWNKLRSSVSGEGAGREAAELDVQTGFGTAKLGLHEEDRRPQLLLPLPAGGRRPVSNQPPAINIATEGLVGPDGSRPYLVMTCAAALEKPFADLCEAVLGRITDGDGPVSAVESAITELRALFEQPAAGDVEEREIRGLLAELVVLSRLCEKDPAAVSLWFGPDSDRHDFRGGRHAIEVKSTRRLPGTVTISSLAQLAIPADGTLDLWCVALERTVGGKLTVADVVRQIEASGANRGDLHARLSAMGCADPSSPEWNRLSFNAEGMAAYTVEEDFPRLVSTGFHGGHTPAGIMSVTYRIDMEQARRFLMSAEEMDLSADRMLACLT